MAIKPIKKLISDILSRKTYLTASRTSSNTTLEVKSGAHIIINTPYLLGELGGESAEIINTHATTVATTTVAQLATTLAHAHNALTPFTELIYNQVEFSHASTLLGTKTTLETTTIAADMEYVQYDDTTHSDGFFFTRYKNSLLSIFSDYSDGVPYAGLAQNTVGKLIEKALARNKLTTFEGTITYQFCLDELNSSLREITARLKNSRWSKLQNFDYILGQTRRGEIGFTLPSDIWENENNKSILGVRIGEQGKPLIWKSKDEWEDKLDNVRVTQVRTAFTSGDTTLYVDNSYDFGDTGSLNVYVNGTKYAAGYSTMVRDDATGAAAAFGNIPSTGTEAITTTVAVDIYVWQEESEGEPEWYTVWGGSLKVWPLADVDFDDKNVYLDYFTGPTEVDTDSDELDAFRYDACLNWLVWAIRMQKENDGRRDLQDADYIQFERVLSNYIGGEVPAHNITRKVKFVTLN